VAGQTVWVGFLVQTNAALPSRAWVDDAALTITTPAAPPPQTQRTLFLPLIFKAPPENPPPPPGGGQPNAFWLPYTSATGELLPTYGTSIAVDKAGGIHVGYGIYTGLDNGHRPAYYAYCPAICTNPANWTRTRLSDFVQDVRLALDPAGHPRMLFYTSNNPSLSDNIHEYQYAVCDSGCASSANWTISVVARVDEIPGRRSEQNNRYFALDGQGHPAFVYTDAAGGHTGTFYIHCDHDCTLAASWSEINLSSDHYFGKSALAFTPAGQPRLAVDYFGFDEQRQAYLTKLLYLGCDTACDDPGQWQSLFLYSSIGDANFSLQVDSYGRPRIALYPGNYVSPPLQPYLLHYIWCNTACFDPTANNWYQASVGLPENHGGGIDLVLDQANRPRLAYEMGGEGLGYAWCTANCESPNPSWQRRTIESTTAIIARYPNFPVYSCSIQTWFNGKRPSLALNPAGKPHIGYDAEHWWGGYDKYGNKCNVNVPLARFALFN
jgi:hypothetical protein